MMFLEAVLAGLVISAASYFARFLSGSGAIATFLFAVPIFGLGGWRFTVPVLTFFISSSLLSRFNGDGKKNLSDLFAKSIRRDAGQVLANGGVPTLLVILWYMQSDERYYLAYLGSLSAVAADTWSTELGVLSRKQPRLITNLVRVTRGTSGAISPLGVSAGLLGSILIFVSAIWWLRGTQLDATSMWVVLFAVVLSGLIGNLGDSVLGATLQAQYRCDSCGKVTERKLHCRGSSSILARGQKWMTNDIVNLICSLVGGGVGFCSVPF